MFSKFGKREEARIFYNTQTINTLKVLLSSAVAAALVFGFAGCADGSDDGDAINGENIEFTHGQASDTVTADDAAGYNYYRGFKTTKTNHYSSNALITIEKPELSATDASHSVVSNAGLGFVFGEYDDSEKVKQDGKDKSVKVYTFGIASVRYNVNTKKVQWYVSWVEKTPETVFGYNNSSDFTDKIGDDKVELGKETQIIPTSGAWKNTSVALTDGNLVVKIAVTANDDGSYKVELQNADGSETYETATISNTVTGFEKKTQQRIGRYLTVYYKQTVKGSIAYSDIQGNPIPADYDEE